MQHFHVSLLIVIRKYFHGEGLSDASSITGRNNNIICLENRTPAAAIVCNLPISSLCRLENITFQHDLIEHFSMFLTESEQNYR